MRNAIAVPAITAVLIASFVAGCGGGSSSSSTTTASATTIGNGTSPVCAAYSQLRSFNDLKQLDPSNASRVQATMRNVNLAVGSLEAAVFQLPGQAGSNAQSAVSSFQSQFNSAQGQPVSQQVTTVGTALSQLESSLRQTATELGCKP